MHRKSHILAEKRRNKACLPPCPINHPLSPLAYSGTSAPCDCAQHLHDGVAMLAFEAAVWLPASLGLPAYKEIQC